MADRKITPTQLAENVQDITGLLARFVKDADVLLKIAGPDTAAHMLAKAYLNELTPGQLASVAAVATVRLMEAGWKPEASGG